MTVDTTNNIDSEIEISDGQMDLMTGEVVEKESEKEVTVEEIVETLTENVFGSDITITAYKIHTIINGTFKVVGFEKQVPPQMMYNYSRNGMINGVKNVKQYTREEVTKFVIKYVNKQMSK